MFEAQGLVYQARSSVLEAWSSLLREGNHLPHGGLRGTPKSRLESTSPQPAGEAVLSDEL